MSDLSTFNKPQEKQIPQEITPNANYVHYAHIQYDPMYIAVAPEKVNMQ